MSESDYTSDASDSSVDAPEPTPAPPPSPVEEAEPVAMKIEKPKKRQMSEKQLAVLAAARAKRMQNIADRKQAKEAAAGQPKATKTKKKKNCLLYTSPSPRDGLLSRMPSSA